MAKNTLDRTNSDRSKEEKPFTEVEYGRLLIGSLAGESWRTRQAFSNLNLYPMRKIIVEEGSSKSNSPGSPLSRRSSPYSSPRSGAGGLLVPRTASAGDKSLSDNPDSERRRSQSPDHDIKRRTRSSSKLAAQIQGGVGTTSNPHSVDAKRQTRSSSKIVGQIQAALGSNTLNYSPGSGPGSGGSSGPGSPPCGGGGQSARQSDYQSAMSADAKRRTRSSSKINAQIQAAGGPTLSGLSPSSPSDPFLLTKGKDKKYQDGGFCIPSRASQIGFAGNNTADRGGGNDIGEFEIRRSHSATPLGVTFSQKGGGSISEVRGTLQYGGDRKSESSLKDTRLTIVPDNTDRDRQTIFNIYNMRQSRNQSVGNESTGTTNELVKNPILISSKNPTAKNRRLDEALHNAFYHSQSYVDYQKVMPFRELRDPRVHVFILGDVPDVPEILRYIKGFLGFRVLLREDKVGVLLKRSLAKRKVVDSLSILQSLRDIASNSCIATICITNYELGGNIDYSNTGFSMVMDYSRNHGNCVEAGLWGGYGGYNATTFASSNHLNLPLLDPRNLYAQNSILAKKRTLVLDQNFNPPMLPNVSMSSPTNVSSMRTSHPTPFAAQGGGMGVGSVGMSGVQSMGFALADIKNSTPNSALNPSALNGTSETSGNNRIPHKPLYGDGPTSNQISRRYKQAAQAPTNNAIIGSSNDTGNVGNKEGDSGKIKNTRVSISHVPQISEFYSSHAQTSPHDGENKNQSTMYKYADTWSKNEGGDKSNSGNGFNVGNGGDMFSVGYNGNKSKFVLHDTSMRISIFSVNLGGHHSRDEQVIPSSTVIKMTLKEILLAIRIKHCYFFECLLNPTKIETNPPTNISFGKSSGFASRSQGGQSPRGQRQESQSPGGLPGGSPGGQQVGRSPPNRQSFAQQREVDHLGASEGTAEGRATVLEGSDDALLRENFSPGTTSSQVRDAQDSSDDVDRMTSGKTDINRIDSRPTDLDLNSPQPKNNTDKSIAESELINKIDSDKRGSEPTSTTSSQFGESSTAVSELNELKRRRVWRKLYADELGNIPLRLCPSCCRKLHLIGQSDPLDRLMRLPGLLALHFKDEAKTMLRIALKSGCPTYIKAGKESASAYQAAEGGIDQNNYFRSRIVDRIEEERKFRTFFKQCGLTKPGMFDGTCYDKRLDERKREERLQEEQNEADETARRKFKEDLLLKREADKKNNQVDDKSLIVTEQGIVEPTEVERNNRYTTCNDEVEFDMDHTTSAPFRAGAAPSVALIAREDDDDLDSSVPFKSMKKYKRRLERGETTQDGMLDEDFKHLLRGNTVQDGVLAEGVAESSNLSIGPGQDGGVESLKQSKNNLNKSHKDDIIDSPGGDVGGKKMFLREETWVPDESKTLGPGGNKDSPNVSPTATATTTFNALINRKTVERSETHHQDGLVASSSDHALGTSDGSFSKPTIQSSEVERKVSAPNGECNGSSSPLTMKLQSSNQDGSPNPNGSCNTTQSHSALVDDLLEHKSTKGKFDSNLHKSLGKSMKDKTKKLSSSSMTNSGSDDVSLKNGGLKGGPFAGYTPPSSTGRNMNLPDVPIGGRGPGAKHPWTTIDGKKVYVDDIDYTHMIKQQEVNEEEILEGCLTLDSWKEILALELGEDLDHIFDEVPEYTFKKQTSEQVPDSTTLKTTFIT